MHFAIRDSHSTTLSVPGAKRPPRGCALAGLLLLALMTSTPAAGAVVHLLATGTKVRTDLRTVILSPSTRKGWMRVTVFLAFRVAAGSAPDATLSMYLPVEGVPRVVKAQAMTVFDFDRRYTHATGLEGAFYDRVCAEQAGRTCLYTSIAANGGLPAWVLLAPRWPPKGPALTAVVPAQRCSPVELHEVRAVRILRVRDVLMRASALADTQALAALRRFGDDHVIAVSVTPGLTGSGDMKQPATAGVRISYEAPLRAADQGEAFRFPLVSGSQAGSPALTRIYLAAPWNCRAEMTLGGNVRRTTSPSQAVVNDVLGAFGDSDSFRASRAREKAGVRLSSVRTGRGGETTRAVCAFVDFDRDLEVSLRRSATGAMRITSVAVGRVLYGLLWPVTAALYLVALYAAAQAYFWMTLLHKPEGMLRRMALLAGLGPVLTPWLMLRYLAPAGERPSEGDGTGALGVLSPRDYECVVRLVLWALLVCVNWAIVESLVRLALWLRFE